MQNDYGGLHSLIDTVEVKAGATLQFGGLSFEVAFANLAMDITAITVPVDEAKEEYMVGIRRHIPKRLRTMVSLQEEKKVILLHEIVETLEQRLYDRLFGRLPDYKADSGAWAHAAIKRMEKTHNEACRQELLYSGSREMERIRSPPFWN